MSRKFTLDATAAHLKAQKATGPEHMRQFYTDRIAQLLAWKASGRTPDNDANVREACEEFMRLGSGAQ